MRRLIQDESPAWVVAHSYHVAPPALASDRPMWVDFHNVDSVIWQRLSRSAPSPFVRIATTWQAPLVKRYEDRLYREAVGFSAVSRSMPTSCAPVRPRHLRSWSRTASTWSAMHFDLNSRTTRSCCSSATCAGIPTPMASRGSPKRCGRSFAARLRTARVEILGRGASDALLSLADDRLTFIGGVPDTRPAWERAAIGIVPLLTGGGTRLKILEASAMGVPVVSTRSVPRVCR